MGGDIFNKKTEKSKEISLVLVLPLGEQQIYKKILNPNKTRMI